MDKKTPVDFMTLPEGMRHSDGPPPHKQSLATKQPVDKTHPQAGSNNPFASFMPLSTREREALKLSDDEISSTLDTFSPLDQPDIPRTISGSISNIIPPTIPRSKRRDATAKVKIPDPSAVHAIHAEDLVPIESDIPSTSPKENRKNSLMKKLTIGATILLVICIGGVAFILLTTDNAIENKSARTPPQKESSLSQASKPKQATQEVEQHTPDSKTKTASVTAPSSKKTVVEAQLKRSNAIADKETSKKQLKQNATSPTSEIVSPPSTPNADVPPIVIEKEQTVKTSGDSKSSDDTENKAAQSASPDMVTIRLTGIPRDAAVTVNGKAMDSPFQIPRSLKALKVVVNAPDYEPSIKRIVPGQDKAVLIKMKRK